LTFAANLVQKENPEILGVSYSISESDLLSLVNAERQSRGLAPLSLRGELDDAARRKAADMFQKIRRFGLDEFGNTQGQYLIR
jgi:uncharacterized protein YkwD